MNSINKVQCDTINAYTRPLNGTRSFVLMILFSSNKSCRIFIISPEIKNLCQLLMGHNFCPQYIPIKIKVEELFKVKITYNYSHYIVLVQKKHKLCCTTCNHIIQLDCFVSYCDGDGVDMMAQW